MGDVLRVLKKPLKFINFSIILLSKMHKWFENRFIRFKKCIRAARKDFEKQ